jgi:hypothetical protein
MECPQHKGKECTPVVAAAVPCPTCGHVSSPVPTEAYCTVCGRYYAIDKDGHAKLAADGSPLVVEGALPPAKTAVQKIHEMAAAQNRAATPAELAAAETEDAKTFLSAKPVPEVTRSGAPAGTANLSLLTAAERASLSLAAQRKLALDREAYDRAHQEDPS